MIATRALEWFTTTDHKRIGALYWLYAFAAAVVGGAFAGAIRAQLSHANAEFLTPDLYNQFVGMHASIMIFAVVIPAFAGFAVGLVPLMIGTTGMAFPRANAFAFWLLIPSLVLALACMKFGATGSGWTAYPPLSTRAYSNYAGMDLWILAVILYSLSSLLLSVNLVVTLATRRAAGMRWFRMPMFCWGVLVTAWLQLLAAPVLITAMVMLLADRLLGTGFFAVGLGGDPLLYQHLFWFYSHPVVYIMILPGFGIVSHVIPAFSGRRLFGYKSMVWATLLIGVLGVSVWGHHMFAAGLPTWMRAMFGFLTMAIAVPTGIKVFNWIATLWGGSIRFTTAMHFALGFIALFTMGGITGVMLALVPVNLQLHDTWFVVGHLHYVLFGGSVMTIMAGTYYWFPKFTGAYLSERAGRAAFWLLFAGMNLTFLPMHLLGIAGVARRTFTYPERFETINALASGGYLLMLAGGLIFLADAVRTIRRETTGAPADCWDAKGADASPEWSTASPPPPWNFEKEPEFT